MTISRIILLTGDAEAPFLTDRLKRHKPSLTVDHADDRESLTRLCANDCAGTRLVSFCSAVIVPESILSALPGPSYNFHPGPPDRPGRFPAVFAVYEGAEQFGVTVHEMTARVDAGPIVGVDWFFAPKGCDLETLEGMAFSALAAKFNTLAPHLALFARPLPRLPVSWSGRKTCKADRDALCRVPSGLDATEMERRRRACGGALQEASAAYDT